MTQDTAKRIAQLARTFSHATGEVGRSIIRVTDAEKHLAAQEENLSERKKVVTKAYRELQEAMNENTNRTI